MDYRRYGVSPKDRRPVLDFLLDALRSSGCRILRHSGAASAPFRISYEDPSGRPGGIIAYAFLANSRSTRNRPDDEHRFQIKYGAKDGLEHELWTDPYEVYTTLLLGVHLEAGVIVSADVALHNPTKFFISFEFKDDSVQQIRKESWHSWERTKRSRGFEAPTEVVLGCVPERFLDLVHFEQAARGLSQGHRMLLADRIEELPVIGTSSTSTRGSKEVPRPNEQAAKRLASEFELSVEEILGIIEVAPRLKMAVRGWVAEKHLEDLLNAAPEVACAERLEKDGQPDFEVQFHDRTEPCLIECKNVLRKPLTDGTIKVDFQKTRASKGDPCSRYYRPTEFEVLAACLHPRTEIWEFRFQLTRVMQGHSKCPGHLSNNVRIDAGWDKEIGRLVTKL